MAATWLIRFMSRPTHRSQHQTATRVYYWSASRALLVPSNLWGGWAFFFFFFFIFFWDQQPVAGTANLVTWAPYHLRPTLWNWRLFLLSHLLDVTSILEWSVADRFDRQVFFYLQLFCLIEIQWKSINFKCFFGGGRRTSSFRETLCNQVVLNQRSSDVSMTNYISRFTGIHFEIEWITFFVSVT